MSESRLPNVIYEVSLPGKRGKKEAKIELFSASQYREYAMSPSCSKRFDPSIPLNIHARREYFKTMFRVRLNGRFVKSKESKRLKMFTKKQAFEKFAEII